MTRIIGDDDTMMMMLTTVRAMPMVSPFKAIVPPNIDEEELEQTIPIPQPTVRDGANFRKISVASLAAMIMPFAHVEESLAQRVAGSAEQAIGAALRCDNNSVVANNYRMGKSDTYVFIATLPNTASCPTVVSNIQTNLQNGYFQLVNGRGKLQLPKGSIDRWSRDASRIPVSAESGYQGWSVSFPEGSVAVNLGG
jgi:hypothetical protein